MQIFNINAGNNGYSTLNNNNTNESSSSSNKWCRQHRHLFMMFVATLLLVATIYYLLLLSCNDDQQQSALQSFRWTFDDMRQTVEQKPQKNDWTRMCAGNVSGEEFDRLFPPWNLSATTIAINNNSISSPSSNELYILSEWSKYCGGLGNQMWRFAGLWAIGKPYGRKAIFTEDQRCANSKGFSHEVEAQDEMENLFPVYATQIKYIRTNPKDTFVLQGFFQHCCRFYDPQQMKLDKIGHKYLMIPTQQHFQSYKYFVTQREQIRQIFQFGPRICAVVSRYHAELFSDDLESHKLCVHTRLGDFVNQYHWAKTEELKQFTEKAIDFLYAQLREKYGDTSVVLLGADKQFLANLSISRTSIPHVYIPKRMPRGEDLGFGATACDSLLITTAPSTFAWWIGYLMPDGANIFYNAQMEGTPYNRDNFLPEWTGIRLRNGSIVVEK